MALSSSWFHDWNPPANLLPDRVHFNTPGPVRDFNVKPGSVRDFNLDHNYYIHHDQQNSNENPYTMSKFLPLLLSLGVVSSGVDGVRQRHPQAIGAQRGHVLSPTLQGVPVHRTHAQRTLAQRTKSPKYIDRTGPFRTWYQWKQLDFAYPTEEARLSAILNKDFIQENNLPLGLEVYGDRLFVSMPKWKPGVPATLAVLPRVPKEPSPKLVPYPNWEWHSTGSCNGITSVFRMQADACGRLWVLDSGQIDVTIKPNQVCPPAIFVFDLNTDELLFRYEVPKDFILESSLYSNIVVDIRHNDCEDTHAYVTDVWRFGLLVFSLQKMRSWRVADHLFYPDPLAAAYSVHNLNFEWTDGIFGIALSPMNPKTMDRLIYFHPMSSFREFFATASVVRNETGWMGVKDAFKVLGESRGKAGHASASSMDRNGILFYNLVSRDAVGCWDSRKPYKRSNQGLVAYNNETMIFPNDLKIDQEKRQSVWVITNRLPLYLYQGLDKEDVNFRIMSAYTDEAIQSTICDPNYSDFDTYDEVLNGEDCY